MTNRPSQHAIYQRRRRGGSLGGFPLERPRRNGTPANKTCSARASEDGLNVSQIKITASFHQSILDEIKRISCCCFEQCNKSLDTWKRCILYNVSTCRHVKTARSQDTESFKKEFNVASCRCISEQYRPNVAASYILKYAIFAFCLCRFKVVCTEHTHTQTHTRARTHTHTRMHAHTEHLYNLIPLKQSKRYSIYRRLY